MSKLRVALISNIPSPYRVDLWDYMSKNVDGMELKIIYTSPNEDNRQWTIDEKKMENSVILKSRVLKIRNKQDCRYIHWAVNVLPTLKEFDPEVVIAIEYNSAALQALFWCKLHRKKFIHLTDGTLYSERKLNIIQKISRRIIISNAASYIASSTKSKEKLVKWGAQEELIEIAYLTTNIQSYRNITPKRIEGHILYVGSMVPRKGIDLLFNALSYVKSKYTLHVVGNGTEDEISRLKLLAKEKGIEKNIVWSGYKEGEELLKEYQEARLFVLPTREDCFGLVLLEAAASRVPIVASMYADGAYDVVGNNGVLVNPMNMKEFGQSIEEVLNDKKYILEAEKIILDNFEYKNVTLGYKKAINKALKNEVL